MKRRNILQAAAALFAIAALALCTHTMPVSAAPSDAGDAEDTPQPILAYVKFDQRLDDGSVQFLVDPVLWIVDAELPNDYGLYNEVEDWTPYRATAETACSLWFFVEEDDIGFMESVEMGLDEFVAHLLDSWRDGMLLANLTVSEDVIESIFEQYTP